MGSRMWRAQIDAVGDRKVVAPPLPGFDGQPRLAEPEIDAYARDVLTRLDA